jgi:flagellar biosynthesis/type III secretory pathway chaperone
MKFKNHFVNSRKDLLHFLEGELDKKVLKKVGKHPKKWIEELNIISQILTGDALSASVDSFSPPLNDQRFQKLGENVFLLRNANNGNGLWFSTQIKDYESLERDSTRIEWTHYALGGRAN